MKKGVIIWTAFLVLFALHFASALPKVAINFPANASLNISTPLLNVTVNGSDIDSVWISVDGGQNITYAHRNGTIDFGYLNLIFADDFDEYLNGSDGSPTWTNPPIFRTARIEDKTYKLHNETAIIDALSYVNNFSHLDYSASAKVKVPVGAFGGAYLTPRFNDVNNKYEIALDYDFSSININKAVGGVWSSLGALWTGSLPTPVFVSKGEWHKLGLGVKGTNISAYVDNQIALSVVDTSLSYLGFSIIAFDDTSTHTAYFDDFEVHNELRYGTHTLRVYANDSAGNVNSSSVSFFVGVDSYPPAVFLNSPPDGTGAATNATFFSANFTDDAQLKNATLYVWNSTSLIGTNFTNISGAVNMTNLSLTLPRDGTYFWNYLAYDNSSNSAFNNSNFTLIYDSVKPLINFVYPLNTTYNSIQTILNYSASDLNLQSCWYSLNLGVSNVSLTCGTNVTGLNSAEGSNIWRVYANDSAGNVNSSSVSFFVDSLFPVFSGFVESPSNGSAYVQGQVYRFNATINETNLLNAGIEFGGINYSVQNVSDVYIFNISNLATGNYQYYWWANDSIGNYNISGVRVYTVNKSVQLITPLLNGNNANLIVSYPQQINASYSGANQTAVSININGTSVNIGQNYTFAAGGYVVNYSALANQNYSAFSGFLNLTINAGTSEVNLTLNGTEGNITIVQGTSILLNGTLITGDNSARVLLYNDGILINNNTNEASNLTNFTQTGLFNISVFYEGSQNYSGSFETYFVNVTAGALSTGNNSAPIINYNYTIVNGTAKTPIFGDNFFIQANVSDAENDTVSVGFTIISPNGTRVLDNVLGSSFIIGNYGIWNSTNYTVNDYGYWNWSVLASDGLNSTQQNGSFRVLADLSIFPAEYIVTPDPKNQTLIWNLSMYHNSLENYNFTFSYTLNTSFFNLSFTNGSAILSKVVYNDTNLFKNQIMINISNSVIEGVVYDGNVTIQRILDGKNYTVPLKIGVNPPSGDADALDTPSLNVCSDGTCDVDTTMQNDESKSFNWTIKNTGNFTLTNCKPAISGFSITNFGAFNLNNFELNISESKNLVLTISQPPINSYYGKLEVVCQATVLGFNDSLGADSENVPGLRLIVTADTGGGTTPTTGGSGGSSGGSATGLVIEDNFELDADALERLEIGRGESEAIALTVKNTGNKFLNGCYISADSGVSSWISTNQIESLSPGQEADYIFTVNTPIDAEEGDYFVNLNINCKEASLTQRYDISVVGGEFEIILLSSARDGTKLLVNYAAESFADVEKEISMHYELIDSKQNSVAEGDVDKFNLGAREKIEKSFEFELPKNSVGDYHLIVQASDGVDTGRYEQAVRLTNKGLTGFAISDANLRAISWFGVIVLVCGGIYLAVKMIRRQISLRHAGEKHKRQFITIDLKS